MRFPSVPGPSDLRQLVEQAVAVAPRAANLLTGAEALLASAGGIIGQVQALLVRVEGLLEEVEGVRVRADEVIDGVDGVRERADDTIAGVQDVRAKADQAIGGVDDVRERASDMVDQAQRIADKGERAMGGLDDVRERADVLLRRVEEGAVGRMLDLAERLEPTLQALEPVLVRLGESTTPEEVDAVVAMVDKLPALETALREDVMPLLQRLGSVAPDMHEMLEVTRELSELVMNLPGMGRIKKKVDEQQDD
ncbi:hypothetical protein G6553_04785 [Nocardioides sp. IC4_145]|uniref:hypothetical protein n=1 Tax=Nocardioides sp. IC4_145 TaxID=2714037 RepID=UPI00140AA359|nr:hypothetical protein [Nocardioides sp. IC4_145]NHC22488.1 hypothetical protein [Nocardioides sp. IC4_145]